MDDVSVHQDLATRSEPGRWIAWHRGAMATGPTRAAALWSLIENAELRAEIAAEDWAENGHPEPDPKAHAAVIPVDVAAYASHHQIDLNQGRADVQAEEDVASDMADLAPEEASALSPHGYCNGHDGCATCVTAAEREEAEELAQFS
ncbi:hypothetical protein ABT246_25760 [Streptomyces sp. NPDC001553]|uniref:hypothetical protein n=1 Tax=Streptomyces sp. NPDC001553 TaxID=3154385 RepID=UPI003319CEB0